MTTIFDAGKGSQAMTKNSKFIKASPEAIYRAFTDPAALAEWFAPGDMTGVVHHFDYRVGGGFQMSLYYPSSEKTSRGKTSEREDRYTARFLELTPNRRIVEAITFDSDDPAFSGEMIMEVTLEAEDGGTTVSILFKNIPSGIRPEDNEAGTRSTLEKLAGYVEQGEMTEYRSQSLDTAPQAGQPSTPNPALRRLDRLVGKWELKGRTLDSPEDNITGWTTFEWLPGGFFLKSEGEINFKGFLMQSLEVISYDPKRGNFPSSVYSSMVGDVLPYEWDIQGNTVIHSGLGATYTGTISEDGNTLSGGWRPDEGMPVTDGAAYDALMTRVK